MVFPQVDVYIFESKGIKFVEVPDTLGEHFKELVKITHTNQKAHVVFRPTIQQQRKCSSCSVPTNSQKASTDGKAPTSQESQLSAMKRLQMVKKKAAQRKLKK